MFHCIYRRKLVLQIKNRDPTATSHVYLLFLQNPSSLRFISSISSTTGKQPSFTISYLVNSCGLSSESAISASKKVHLKTTENPDSVLKLFRDHGFTKTQITKLITKCPSLLLSDPDKTLNPKIEFFNRSGVSSPNVTKILSSSPFIFNKSLKNVIIPSFDYLRNLLHTNENITAALIRSSRLLHRNMLSVMTPNISILRDHGVSESTILKLLTTQPRTVILSTDRFSEIVELVKKMGLDPKSLNFVLAIRIMSGMTRSSWNRKVAIYRSLGWSEDEFISAFRVQPMCMGTSEEKIRKFAAFILNEMGWNMSAISKCPNLLRYSLQKRIAPRCSVLQILVSKGLVKDLNLIWVLNVCEKVFLEKFLIKNQEAVPEILSVYQDKGGPVKFGAVAGIEKL